MLSASLGLWGFKGFPRRTISDKVLRVKAFSIAKNPKYDGYQHGLASMVYKFFDKRSSDGNTLCDAIMHNQQKNNTKLINGKFERRKVYWSFKNNMRGAYPVDMQLISKYNKGFGFYYMFIDIYS